MQIKEIIPKLWYWKKAAWTRPQWWCYDCMKPYLKYKDNDEYHSVCGKCNLDVLETR